VAKVFVTRRLPGPAIDRLAERHQTTIWQQRLPPTPDELRAAIKDADGLLCLLTDRIDAQLIDAAPRLKAIANYAVGTDNIDLEAATRRNIPVGNTPDVLTEATADLTFALLLAAARRLPEAIDAVKRDDWITWEPAHLLGAAVHGQTLGIIGYGRIGQAVAARAAGFGMRILHTKQDDLDTILTQSDFISLHTPLTQQTHHLIDAQELAKLKPTAILINTARGAIVDQQALAEALTNNTLAAAAIDVTDPEPPPPQDPIHRTPNLLITPHIGSATTEARERMAYLAVENLLEALDGHKMRHQAN
jgi:lactate dehydrogenase-like 2-hydroxyacid dehydrogenase